MNHWTDSLAGATCRTLGNNKLHMMPGKELNEGDSIYSPIFVKHSQSCQHCNATNNEIMGVQVHIIVRTKSGKREGRLLWKHDGYIPMSPPLLDFKEINLHGIKWILDNKKPFCVSWWSSSRPQTFSGVIKEMKSMSNTQFMREAYRFWHPNQWDKAPTRENSAMSALEKM